MKKLYLFFIIIIFNQFTAFSSPYELSDFDNKMYYTIPTVLGLTYKLFYQNPQGLSVSEIENLMKKELLSINKLSVNNYNNDIALLSDILLTMSLSIAAFQVFDGKIISDWPTYGAMFLETTSITLGTTLITKNIVREPRPYIYSEKAPLELKKDPDASQSFFSGHAALSFASMMFFAEIYSSYYPENSNHYLIYLGSIALASTSSILRIFSARHFPIDVLVGAVVGITIGKLIPYIHEKKNEQNFIINNKSQKIFSINLNL